MNMPLGLKRFQTPAYAVVWLAPLVMWVGVFLMEIHRDADLFVSRLGIWETDEGAYAYNATAAERYDELVTPGDLNTVIYCPFLTVIQRVFFRVFGIHLWSSRIQGLFSFLLAQVLMLLLFRHRRMLSAGAVCLGMVSLNYLMFVYSRSSLPEVHMGTYFALISWVLLRRRKSGFSLGEGAVLGALSFLAVMTKLSFVTYPAGIGLFLFFRYVLGKPRFDKRALLALGGMVLVLGVGMFLYYRLWILPRPVEWEINREAIFDSSRFARGLLAPLFHLYVFLRQLVTHNPWTAFPFWMVIASLPATFVRIKEKGVGVPEYMQLWGWSLSICQILVVGVHPYQPARWYAGFCWPWALILAGFLVRVGEALNSNWNPTFSRMCGILPFLAGLFGVLLGGLMIFVPLPALLAVWLVGFFYMVFAFDILPARFGQTALMLFFLSVPASTFGSSFSIWKEYSSDSYYRALMDMKKHVPENSIVMGRMAGFLSLVHPVKTYWGGRYALNGTNPPPDYALLNRGFPEIEEWGEKNPMLYHYLRNGWDPDFKPREYEIMGNYYSGTNTILLKIQKEARVQVVDSLPQPAVPLNILPE